MEKKPKSIWGPSFFKVLLDYTRRLRLPPVFVRDYGEYLHGSAKFRASWGKTWNLKIEEEIYDDDEKYMCFVGKGWKKFVRDLELKLGEFVIFVFDSDESVFDVTVFGTDFCERRVSATTAPAPVESGADSGLIVDKLSFTAVLRDYNRFIMDIPKAFAEATGIVGKSRIKLENVKGKEWVVEKPVMLGRSRMSKGWRNFYEENKLVVGDKCLFEFDPVSGNLIMKKEGEEGKESSGKRRPAYSGATEPTVRGRGRPRKNVDGGEGGSENPRGRGRPCKNVVNIESDSDDDSELLRGTGGMGRSLMNVVNVDSDDDDDDDNSKFLAGKGQGRPRKNVMDVKMDSDSDESDSEFLTVRGSGSGSGRGRGRGRGRPRKNVVDVVFDFDKEEDDIEFRGRGKPPTDLFHVEFEFDDEDYSKFLIERGRGRGRGRGMGRGKPSTNMSDVEFDSNDDDDDDDYSKFLTGRKRGRGRPPKTFLDVETDVDDSDDDDDYESEF